MPDPIDERFEATLHDGTPVVFRPLRPADKAYLQKGLSRMSARSRYRRFLAPVERLTDAQLRYLTELDFRNHVAWAVGLPGDDPSTGIGVGRWIRLGDRPDLAEPAVTVLDAYQGQGIGKTLIWLLVRSAIAQGIRAFRVETLAENRPILQLLRSVGSPPGQWRTGVLETEVPLPESVEAFEHTVPPPLPLRPAPH